jgi:hypothetical protein
MDSRCRLLSIWQEPYLPRLTPSFLPLFSPPSLPSSLFSSFPPDLCLFPLPLSLPQQPSLRRQQQLELQAAGTETGTFYHTYAQPGDPRPPFRSLSTSLEFFYFLSLQSQPYDIYTVTHVHTTDNARLIPSTTDTHPSAPPLILFSSIPSLIPSFVSPLSHPNIVLIRTCLILPPFTLIPPPYTLIPLTFTLIPLPYTLIPLPYTLIPLPFTLIPPCPSPPCLFQAQEHSDLSQSLPLSLSSSVWVRASERMDALQVGFTLRVYPLPEGLSHMSPPSTAFYSRFQYSLILFSYPFPYVIC